MNIEKIKNIVFISVITILLSGCTATYNIDISSDNIYETLSINATTIDESEYYIPAYYNSITDDMFDVDIHRKIDSIIYYDTTVNSNEIIFDYQFTNVDFSKSNIANSLYSSFVFKQYDHDEDGEKDYYIISTTNDFKAFSTYKELTEVTITIKTNYEVISHNADEIDGNIYIWHFTPNNTSSVNMVYNPDKIVDNRSLWQKIKDGEYTNIFTISIVIFIIGLLVYFIIKKIGDRRNKV